MNRVGFDMSLPRESSVITYGNTRITVLTPCLIRVETGNFTDMPTQKVWYRDLGFARYKVYKKGNLRLIKTEEILLQLRIDSGNVECITLSDGSVVTNFDKGNLLGTARTLDMANGAVKLEKGILSRNGVSVLDDSNSMLLTQKGQVLPRKECTDRYYFAYGRDYSRCLRDFFRLTGNVPLIPKFALGNWWSRYKAYTQTEYQSLMAEFLRRKLPITVATIDMDWHWTDVVSRFGEDARPQKVLNKEELFYNLNSPGWTGYSWNRELFPEPRALLDWLHEKNFHVTLNVHPAQGIRFFEDCYEAACAKLGLDPNSKEQIPFDLSIPKFLETYLDTAHHPLERDGVDFWWIDWQQGKNSGVAGLDPLWALNHFHYMDNGRTGKRPLILSRYAGLGSHRYPLGFSGDTFTTWKSLDFQPYFTNTAANAGYTWWSHDIGGHQFGNQDDELYVRWLQYGVFSPINRLHSSCSEFLGKEPWKRSFAAQTVAESFLRLRHKLIPYLYTANYRTHTEGIPICMPLYYRFDQEEAYRAKNQYIFGGTLLVSPITSHSDPRLNMAKVETWLPEGRWTDFFTGHIYRGGQWVTLHRDLDSIPVLAPAGAILPMYRNGDSNSLSLDQPLDIHIYRGNGSYALYEDDGETMEYRNGKFLKTKMEISEAKDTITFRIREPDGDRSLVPNARKWTLHFRDVCHAEVFVNGVKMETDTSGYLVLPLEFDSETLVHLRNWVPLGNIPKAELESALLTRVQGSNVWKAANFPTPEHPERRFTLPAYLRSALDELDALEY